jgi:hypothetical protein
LTYCERRAWWSERISGLPDPIFPKSVKGTWTTG